MKGLIKQILTKKLNEKLIIENFFEKMDKPLDEVIECVKDILVNLRFFIGEKHKLGFFTNRFIDSLNEFKKSKSVKKISDKVSDLESEFDYELLKELGINKLLMKISKGGNKEELIDAYLKDLNKNVEALYQKYKENIKTDKSYDSIKKINDNTKKITYKNFVKEKYLLQIELLKLQEWAMANDKKVLIVFEGRDAAGKGSNIEAVTEFLNPKGFRVETFGIPTEAEKKNWFNRYNKVLPKKGEIVLFDRSWYNRAVIEPAMGYCTKTQYNEFMNTVGQYEENLIKKQDIILIKIWLDINKDKQKLRFELRKRDPLRYWKFSDNDSKMLVNWGKLTPYIDKMLDETDTPISPWHIVHSDDKLDGILHSIKTVLNNVSYDGKDVTLLSENKLGEKVIFLDIHGVLITEFKSENPGCNENWDKSAIKNLNKITSATHAKIVMVSDCKNRMKFDLLKKNLKAAGVTGEVMGKTISIDKHLRVEQIHHWLKNNKVNDYIVLDDKAFNYRNDKEIEKSWIQTKPEIGITENEANLAIKLLNTK